MSVREIVLWPDARLSAACAPVAEVTDAVRMQVTDMLETMYAAKGRGLAAPQIGVMNRVFVMDIGWKEGRSDPIVCINPIIQDASKVFAVSDEGCLSIPGVTTSVRRPDQVQMVWTSPEGARVVQAFTGFGAACVQHEMDHLDGVVTFDRLEPEARAQAEAEYMA